MRVWILGHQASVRCQVARFLAANITRAAVPTDYACFSMHQACWMERVGNPSCTTQRAAAEG